MMIAKTSVLWALYYADVLHTHAFINTPEPLDSVYHSELRFITTDSHNTHHCMLGAKVKRTA